MLLVILAVAVVCLALFPSVRRAAVNTVAQPVGGLAVMAIAIALLYLACGVE